LFADVIDGVSTGTRTRRQPSGPARLSLRNQRGIRDALDLALYQARFRAYVSALQQEAPLASILVPGPPDGNRLDPSCRRGEARQDACAAGAEGATAPSCSWREPANLAAVRYIQRRRQARRRPVPVL
jgi:hypothetical protein